MNTPPPAPLRDAIREYQAAIEHLYTVFAHRRRGTRPWADIDFPDEKLNLPEQGDVRSLGPTDYAHLAWHAFCFDGNHPPTIKYFLPRLFGEWEFAPFELEMVVSYMNRCHWRRWPAVEVQAIERFIIARFIRLVRTPYARGSQHLVPEIIRLSAFMGIDLIPLFVLWRQEPAPSATLHLAELVDDLINSRCSLAEVMDAWSRLWGKEGVPREIVGHVLQQLASDWAAERIERGQKGGHLDLDKKGVTLIYETKRGSP